MTTNVNVITGAEGAFSAKNIALDEGSIHTYGKAQVEEKITVREDSFFMAHGPLKADTIYASSTEGFGFVRLECKYLIDTVGDDYESIDMQGDVEGEILGATAALKKLGFWNKCLSKSLTRND